MASNSFPLPPVPATLDDPKAMAAYLKAFVLAMTTNLNQIQAQFDQVQGLKGNISVVSTLGGTKLPVLIGPLTNQVAVGGPLNTLTNPSNLTTYSADALTIRQNFYQIGQFLIKIQQALKQVGIGT